MSTREQVRPVVRGFYDIQKLRMQIGLRLVASFKAKLGAVPQQEDEESLGEDARQLLADIRRDYDRVADAIAQHPARRREFVAQGLIGTVEEYALVQMYVNLDVAEEAAYGQVRRVVETHPLWAVFLKGVKGVGPAMAGVILSEIDIHKARYRSSLYCYAGLDCVGGPTDGVGRSRRKEHLVERAYVDKRGQEQTRMAITFNPFLKTKLVGVLAGSFLRAGRGNKYAEVYRNYKHRLECHPRHVEKTKGHRDAMAKRYMIKVFLGDLYEAWRTLEGLPVHVPYAEAKLGAEPHGGVAL